MRLYSDLRVSRLRFNLRFILGLAVLMLATFTSEAARAQEAPSPGGPPPPSSAASQQESEDSPVATIKVQTNLVNLYFSVRDKNGYITNLKKDDCSIEEDKVPQKIKNFTQEKNLPLTIGLLVDVSRSQEYVLPLEQQSGARFLKEVLTPKDEAFLISVSDTVDLMADYTNSPREMERALNKLTVKSGTGSGSVTGNGTPRGTLLFDAIYLAAHDKLRQETGRKIVVILSDGGDQGSQENLKSATEEAQKANAIVYVIYISDPRFFNGLGDMERVTRETGGRVINVGNDGKRLEAAFDQISDELRTQYLASYTPTNDKQDGTFRKLQLTCQKDQKVQARRGYYAVADASADQ